MRHPRALTAFFAFAAAACQPAAPDAVVVSLPWARLSPVAGRPAALYFTLAGAVGPDRLLAIESPRVARIELHENMAGMAHGMGGMRPLAGVDVPPGGTLAFAPGGRHAMLFDVDATLAPGTPLPLRFRFASGRVVAADARTIGASDAAPGQE